MAIADLVQTERVFDRAQPFLKWAGGKRSLLPELLQLVPREIDTYYEPFLGGGALFFALARQKAFRKAVLSDSNEELICCYEAIRDDVDGVVRALEKHVYTSEHYYDVRRKPLPNSSKAKRAARMIFLNRAGFNGLYRVNSRGEFNVPFGRHRFSELFDLDRLQQVSRTLRENRVTLKHQDYKHAIRTIVRRRNPNDFVYFDPPYFPISATASFTAYGSVGFGMKDQRHLAKRLRSLGELRIPGLLSNALCDEARELYGGLAQKEVAVRRAINSIASKRGPVAELVVRSFEYSCARRPASEGR